jgi:hypothetical protein
MNNFLQLYDKSIRLKPNGFSLFKKDNEGKWQYKDVNSPLLTDMLQDFSFFNHNHQKNVTVISNIHVPVLIPKPLFDETAKEDYINLNYEIKEPVYIFDEELEEYHLLHFISEKQKMELEQTGYSLQWLHLSGLLYKELQQSEFYDNRKSCLSLYAEEHFIDVIFEKEGKLQLMNRFEYTSSYDILYYILNIIKQFQVTPTDISLFLYNLQDEETVLLLKQYIGQVFNC